MRFIVNALLSLCCTVALSRGYLNGGQPLVPADNVFSVLFFVLFYVLFYFAFHSLYRHDTVISLIAGFVLAACTSAGANFIQFGSLALTDRYFLLNLAALTIIYTALFLLLFKHAPKLNGAIKKVSPPVGIYNRLFGTKWRAFLTFFAVLAICWLPAFLATYPGHFSYDGPIQAAQIFTDGRLNAHHPVAHTLFMTSLFELGKLISGDYQLGLTLYCVIQALIVAACLSYMGAFLLCKKVPVLVVLLAILFLALNPFVQYFAFTTAKDVLFGAFFLLAILMITDMLLDPETFFEKKARIFAFIIVTLLVCLLRKQGLYVLLLFVPVMLVINRRHLVKQAIAIVVGIVLSLVVTGQVSTAAGVIPSPPQEVLSVPIQQLARAINYAPPEKITEEERAAILEYIPQEALDSYIAEISDPVKDKFNQDAYARDPEGFFSIWAEVGQKTPGMYVDSFLYGSMGYLYPSPALMHQWAVMMDFYTIDDLPIERNSMFPAYTEYLDDVGQSFFSGVPILSTLVSPAVPFWIMVLVAAFLFKRRQYKALVPLLAAFIFLCSLFLAPVMCIRYIIPLLYLIPLIISLPYIFPIQRRE